MTPHLNTIIRDAQKLSPFEQVELIAAVSQFLKGKQNKILINIDFWESRSIKQFAKSQKYKMKEVLEIDPSFWPDDESTDDFNNFVDSQRKEDKIKY